MVKRSPKDYEEMSRAVESGEYTVRSPMEARRNAPHGAPHQRHPRGG